LPPGAAPGATSGGPARRVTKPGSRGRRHRGSSPPGSAQLEDAIGVARRYRPEGHFRSAFGRGWSGALVRGTDQASPTQTEVPLRMPTVYDQDAEHPGSPTGEP